MPDSSLPDAHYRIDDGTTLVNLTDVPDDEWDVYIGRRAPSRDLPHSPHHNPFELEADLDEMEAYTTYKVYFFHRYLTDPEYRVRVQALAGQTLACWCLPDPCHGEIILDLLAARHRDGGDGVREFIANELLAMDSRDLGPQGIAYRARVEEQLGMHTGFAAAAKHD